MNGYDRILRDVEFEFCDCSIINTAVLGWLDDNLYLRNVPNVSKLKHLLANNMDTILDLVSDYIKSSGLELEES